MGLDCLEGREKEGKRMGREGKGRGGERKGRRKGREREREGERDLAPPQKKILAPPLRKMKKNITN